MAVVSALDSQVGFTSAQELHETLEAEGIAVGLTTVYRTLNALNRSGRVDVVRDRTGERLYRLRPADEHCHYLVCRTCGFSTAVEASFVERWADDVAETLRFTEVEHTVELSGVCSRCRVDPTAHPPRNSTPEKRFVRGASGGWQATGRDSARDGAHDRDLATQPAPRRRRSNPG